MKTDLKTCDELTGWEPAPLWLNIALIAPGFAIAILVFGLIVNAIARPQVAEIGPQEASDIIRSQAGYPGKPTLIWKVGETYIASEVTIRPKRFGPWNRAAITTYGPGYHGRGTNSGEVYNENAMTAAAPVVRVNGKVPKGRHRPSIPYGTWIEVRYKGRSIEVRINDTCVGGTLDLSRAAMTRLLGRYANTKVGGEWRVAK